MASLKLNFVWTLSCLVIFDLIIMYVRGFIYEQRWVLCFLFLRQKAIIIISNLEMNTRSLTWTWNMRRTSGVIFTIQRNLFPSSLPFIMVKGCVNSGVFFLFKFIIYLLNNPLNLQIYILLNILLLLTLNKCAPRYLIFH